MHGLLRSSAEARGIDPKRVRELLWLLNAPPDIEGITTVLMNLAEMLACAEQQWPGILDLQHLPWVADIASGLLKAMVLPPTITFERYHPGAGDWLKRNALYGALGIEVRIAATHRKNFLLLLAHYFFAHTAWLLRNQRHATAPTNLFAYECYGGSNVWPALTIDPYHMGLCIRHVADPDFQEWAIRLLDALPLTKSPRELPHFAVLTMPGKVKPTTRTKRVAKQLDTQKNADYIANFLRQIYGVKDRSVGHGSAPGRRNESVIGDPDDPLLDFGALSDWEFEWDSLNRISGVPALPQTPGGSWNAYSEKQSEASPRDDGSFDADAEIEGDEFPEDEENSESFGGSLECDHAEYQRSPGSFSGRAAGAIYQVVRQQKMFPFAIERLDARELVGLSNSNPLWIPDLLDAVRRGRTVRQTVPGRTLTPPKDGPEIQLQPGAQLEALLFVTIMLWTGSNPRRTAKLMICRDESFLSDDALTLVMDNRLYPPDSFFRIQVPFPRYKSIQTPVPDSDRNRTEYMKIPDSRRLSMAIEAYSKWNGLKGDYFRLFQRDLEHYQRNARVLLKSLDPSGRLTLGKIASVLFARIMSLTGNDAVAATMITGTKHRLSTVSMHYACREMAPLRDIYQEVVRSLAHEITSIEASWRLNEPSCAPESDTWHSGPLKPSEGETHNALCLGRRLCPSSDRFRQAVTSLVGELTKPYSSKSRWIHFHNLYTFYTVWMFSIATGVRKVITPYLDPCVVSPINRVALLRDKDGDSGSKAKLIWVPNIVAKQMDLYAKHLNTICNRFQIENPGLLPCFFLGDDGKVQPVRPRNLLPFVSKYLPGFPVDIHRRFIFNYLLETGCPPEVVRVWMGHAVAGEEWWAPDATFSHARYRLHLEKHLVPILEYLGLKPVEGMGHQSNINKEAQNG